MTTITMMSALTDNQDSLSILIAEIGENGSSDYWTESQVLYLSPLNR